MVKARALKTLSDEDWKTQLARGYSSIPSGEIVDVYETDFYNFYGGPYAIVQWNGNSYYVKQFDIEILK